MANEADIEVFQDLRLRGGLGGRDGIRRALISSTSSPWRHAVDREKEIRDVAGENDDVIAFESAASGGLDAVALVLWAQGEGYEVTNIVPLEVGELGYRRYNLALQNFVDVVAEPAARKSVFKIEMTAAKQGLRDWLSPDAVDALRSFSVAANKATGSAHPMDRRRWFSFLLAAHRDRRGLDPERLTRWLTEVEGWPEDQAHDLAIEYEFGLALLDEYDRSGP